MGQARAHHRTNAEEFLAWDSMQTLRHEFVCGELFLKAGAEDRNNTAAGNLCMALRLHLHLHLRGSAWRVYARDVKLRVFGSVAKGLDRADSDLDLWVDLAAGTSLLTVVGLQQDISAALGIAVDLCTEPELQPDLKERILAQARAL